MSAEKTALKCCKLNVMEDAGQSSDTRMLIAMLLVKTRFRRFLLHDTLDSHVNYASAKISVFCFYPETLPETVIVWQID